MEPLFEVKNALTEKMVQEFYLTQFRRGPMRFLYVVGALQLLVGLCMLAALFVQERDSRMASLLLLCLRPLLFWILPGILWGVLGFYVPRMLAKRRTQMLWEDMARPYTIRFFPNEYVQDTPEGEIRTAYSSLQKIVETRNLILFYLQDQTVSIVMKSGFTQGTPDELATFLRRESTASYKRMN